MAALMALADPHVLWDVGFQLSFMATLGLVLYAEPLTQAFTTLITNHVSRITVQRLARPAGEYLLLTLAAQVTSLPVGLDFEALATLQQDRELNHADVLLLAEGGLASLNPPEWIGKLRPQAVLLSVVAGNQYGLPNPETLEAVEGYTLLRTDRNGWIEISTDGERMWVEVERK